MMLSKTYDLANGLKIPMIGLGTWLLNSEETAKAVEAAVKIGYRYFDTAQAYENEEGVGRGIRSSAIPRSEIFVTTKIRAEYKTYDSAAASIDESLQKLGLDTIDLILIHAPQPWSQFRTNENRYFNENREVWRAMEDAYTSGKVKAIGVSNFLSDDLDNILSSCRIHPMVNQMLCHVANTPLPLLYACQKNHILVESYSPVAHGAILNHEKVRTMAERYHVSAAQLCLKYDLQLGTVVLPKTANPDHMKENASLDFMISEEDMNVLKKMEKLDDYGKDGVFPVFAKG